MARRNGMLNQMADFIRSFETEAQQHEPKETDNFSAWKRLLWEQAIQEALLLPECALN